MKWISFFTTLLLQILIVWGIKFMHNITAIIVFLGISLFFGFLFQESREDMLDRPKNILAGFVLATYISLVVISFMVYKKYIPV